MAPWKMLPYMGMFASISALAQKCNDNNYLVGNNTSISDTKIKNKKKTWCTQGGRPELLRGRPGWLTFWTLGVRAPLRSSV